MASWPSPRSAPPACASPPTPMTRSPRFARAPACTSRWCPVKTKAGWPIWRPGPGWARSRARSSSSTPAAAARSSASATIRSSTNASASTSAPCASPSASSSMSPSSPDTLREAMAAMSADLSRLDGRAVPDALVAMGGVVTNMTAVMHRLATYDPAVVQGTVLHRAEIDRQIELYRSMDAAARRSIVGLQPKREDVILAGACIVRTVMGKLGKDSAHGQRSRPAPRRSGRALRDVNRCRVADDRMTPKERAARARSADVVRGPGFGAGPRDPRCKWSKSTRAEGVGGCRGTAPRSRASG